MMTFRCAKFFSFFKPKASYTVGNRVVCRMESDNNWHRGRIIDINKDSADSKLDAIRYLVTFNFQRDDKNRWVHADELLDDVLCGDSMRETKGYGIIFLDRQSYYRFGKMKSADIRSLIIMRQCKICQKMFRFIEAHEKECGFGKRKKGLKVKFNEVIQIRTIPNLDGEI